MASPRHRDEERREAGEAVLLTELGPMLLLIL